jgi:ribokinase
VLNASPVQSLPLDLYPSLDLLCVNATECRSICGIAPMNDGSIKEAIDWFGERGVGSTVITLGSQGSATVIDGKLVKVPAYHVSVVDTTAAGDAYVGELVAHLAFDGTLEESMKYASAAAAICITRVGAQETMPRWDEVEEFVKMREQA